jgi:hypothetical protein
MNTLQRCNHGKAAALPSGGHFLPELKDFEKAQEAFLHTSGKSFQDLNASDLRLCSECVRCCIMISFLLYSLISAKFVLSVKTHVVDTDKKFWLGNLERFLGSFQYLQWTLGT